LRSDPGNGILFLTAHTFSFGGYRQVNIVCKLNILDLLPGNHISKQNNND